MNKCSIFSSTNNKDFYEFLIKYKNFFPVNINLLINDTYKIIKASNHGVDINSDNVIRSIERRWYESLKNNNPDYSVYSDPYYIGDIWSCWVMYSRKSLLSLKHPNSLINQSVISYLSNVKNILDLGCGFGYTTAGLRELFPNSYNVIGTNIKNTFQYEISSDIGKKYNFSVMENYQDKIDMVFASEYFEHIERPIEHLYNIIKVNNPKFFIIANGFNGHAIGHFNYYKYLNHTLTNKEMSKFFLKCMRNFGYRKLDTKIWNNRPSVWQKI